MGWWPSEQRAAEEHCSSLRGTPSLIAASSFGSDAKPTKYNWELGCRIPVGSRGYLSIRHWEPLLWRGFVLNISRNHLKKKKKKHRGNFILVFK